MAKKLLLTLLLLLLPCFGEWIMFSDNKDTYLYNNQTGEVYVRFRKKGKNYQDTFVKMPRGMLPQELNETTLPLDSSSPSKEDPKLQSLQKAKEMMDQALQGSF